MKNPNLSDQYRGNGNLYQPLKFTYKFIPVLQSVSKLFQDVNMKKILFCHKINWTWGVTIGIAQAPCLLG